MKYEEAMRDLLLLIGDLNVLDGRLSALRNKILDDDFQAEVGETDKTKARLRREARELHKFIGDKLKD